MVREHHNQLSPGRVGCRVQDWNVPSIDMRHVTVLGHALLIGQDMQLSPDTETYFWTFSNKYQNT